MPNACRTSCLRAACGDDIVDDGEACDDNNNDDGDGCRGDCSKTEVCGDSIVDVGEACDDGDANPRDGCDACRVQTFVDELLVSGELTSDAFPYIFAKPGPAVADSAGRLFVADNAGHRVMRIDRDDAGAERVVPIAGSGTRGFSGDGGPATAAQLDGPFGIVLDEHRERIYISDSNNHRVRVVDRDGVISTFAGNGSADLPTSEPQGPATEASTVFPTSLALDGDGNLLIAEQGGRRVRRVLLGNSITAPTIETLAGGAIDVADERFAGGECRAAVPVACAPGCPFAERCLPSGFCGLFANSAEDCPDRTFVATPPRPGESRIRAKDVPVAVPTAVWFDDVHGILFADFTNHVVYRIDDDGFIETLLGTRRVNAGFAGDGGPGVRARINGPSGLVVVDGVLYVAEQGNHVVRALDLSTGLVSTHAGTLPTPDPSCTPVFGGEFLVGNGGRSCVFTHPGDSETALNEPLGLSLAADGDFVVTEIGNGAVRTIDAVDGRVSPAFGVPRSLAVVPTVATVFDGFISPGAMAVDGDCRVYIPIIRAGPGPSLITPFPPVLHPQIVRLESDGTVVRVAGTAEAGTAGDGGPATLAQLTDPRALAFDAAGTLFVLDSDRLRRITPDGNINTVAAPGLFAMGSASGRIVGITNDLRSVVAVDGDNVTVITTSPQPLDIAALFDIWPADDGSVYVAGGTALDDNFIDFSLDLFHLEGDDLVPVPFSQTLIAPLFSTRLSLAALVETNPLAAVVVDHDGAVIRRFFADGGAEQIAGDPAGREACVPDFRASTCKRLVDNVGPDLVDTLGDDDLVAPPARDRSTLQTPLRLMQRANLFFPGIDDLEPETPAPRSAAVQRAFPNSRLAFGVDGALLLSEQPTTALEIRSVTELPSPLGGRAGRVRRLDVDENALTTLAGPVHPPGVGPASFPLRLYSPRALAVIDDDIFGVGDFGRVVRELC